MQAKRPFDARKLSHSTLEEIRIRAVKQVEGGESPEVVIAALGMNPRNIYRWIVLYRKGGEAALKAINWLPSLCLRTAFDPKSE